MISPILKAGSAVLLMGGCIAVGGSQCVLAYDKLSISGATPIVTGPLTFSLDGVRARGNGATLDDIFVLRYSIDKNTLAMRVTSKSKFENVGVLNEWFFARDLQTKMPTYTYNGFTYYTGNTYTIKSLQNGTITFKYDLEIGSVMSWNLYYFYKDIQVRLFGEDIDVTSNFAANAGLITAAFPIRAAGQYTLSIKSLDEKPFEITARALNANRTDLKTVRSGDTVSASFYSNLRDYAKFKFFVKQGQYVSLPAPSSDIALKLVGSNSEALGENRGLPLLYKAKYTGIHYLFVYNVKGWGGSYSGTMRIQDFNDGSAEVAASDTYTLQASSASQ